MPTSTLNSDINVAGNLSCQGFTPPAGCIKDAAVAVGGSGANVQATKLQQQIEETVQHSNHATSVAADRRQIHQVYGATASIVQFGVTASVQAGSPGNCVVDLKKNGTTILSATITLDNTTLAYVQKPAAGFTSTALVAGDVLESEIVSVTGTPPKGVSTHLVVRADPQ